MLIEGEKIVDIGEPGTITAGSTVDATGLLVIPGGIDTHVHLNDKFMNTISVHDYFTGTLAAAHGGVTSLVDFSNQIGDEPLINTINRKKKEAAGLSLIDHGIHPVLTPPILNLKEDVRAVVDAGSPSIKCYMTYRQEGLLVEPPDLYNVLEVLKQNNGMLMLHAEDNDSIEKRIPELIAKGHTDFIYHARSRPLSTENAAIDNAIGMIKKVGGRVFIVHMSTGDRIEKLREVYEDGHNIVAETCTHYLIWTDQMLEREDGNKWICSPPLRDQRSQDLLWNGINSGEVRMVTSDDAAYSLEAKKMGKGRFDQVPNGIPGIEPRLNILYSEGVAKGRITVEKWVDICCEAPARLFGMSSQKGKIEKGLDADIVLFDPSDLWTMNQKSLHMATDWSGYEDISVHGKIRKVYSRGELIIDEGQCVAEKGRGKYIFRELTL